MGYNAGANGTYTISGAASLSAASEYVGYSGTGAFAQSAGTNAVSGALYLGYNSAGKGTYTVGGASSLSAASEYLGYAGTGSLAQSAGTNAVSGTLYLGYNSTANSTYALSGTGQLTAAGEYVGYNSAATVSFQQTGGTNTATNLTIGAGDQYLLSGGTLTINGSLINKGTVNGGNGSATLGANCLVDLTSGTWKNYSDWSVNIGTTGLVIVPAGFNVATGFAGVTTAGLNVHVTGTPLTVPAGDGFTGVGTIGDPTANQGTITVASGGALNFTGGLNVSGSGSASLGTGNLTVNNASSGMSGTTLSAANLYVGSGGTGALHPLGRNQFALVIPLSRLQFARYGELRLERHGQALRFGRLPYGQPVHRLFRHGQLHAVGRDKQPRGQSLSRLQLDRRGNVQLERGRAE